MKLRKAHVKEYKSVWDSNEFDVGQVTCLVGKNEAGKTALLHALYRLNPIGTETGAFDTTDDYPRSEVENYLQDVESKKREHAIVVKATFELEPPEMEAIRGEYGDSALAKNTITVSKGYARNDDKKNTLFIGVPVNEANVVKHLLRSFAVPDPVTKMMAKVQTVNELNQQLAAHAQKQEQSFSAAKAEAAKITGEAEKAAALEKCKELSESEQAKALRAKLPELLKSASIGLHIWQTVLSKTFPKFLYFDEYYKMRGHDNVEALKKRQAEKALRPSDHPLLGLIELARLDLDKLLAQSRTQELKNKLQGASNHLSGQILKYWSQNKHLRMVFDVRPAMSGDPDGMQSGTNIWGEIHDAKHLVSTGLGTRSTGFVWFFSFLAWYSSVKKKDEPLILLLDEPGLSLHGIAQEDLLKYFDAEISTNPKHQLIYTTHSPFLVDAQHFDRVRIVQDKGIDSDDVLPRDQDGTKVFTDVLEAGPDSLFPLQGALGYQIYQTLFIGPNSLVVEGVSDLLYLQTLSGILSSRGKVGLDSRWTITPVGGADKVPTFVSLIGSQKGLNVATLIDFQKSSQQMIENLYKKQLLEKSHVLTFADFTGAKEADAEDMFGDAFYLSLINAEFSGSLTKPITMGDIVSGSPRVLVRVEKHLTASPLGGSGKFNHYRPARYLSEKASSLTIPADALDRFEKAFVAVNALLKG